MTMHMTSSFLLPLIFLLQLFLHHQTYAKAVSYTGSHIPIRTRVIQIFNESDRRIEIYWVDEANNDNLVINTEPFLLPGERFNIESQVGHLFQVRELPGEKSGVCKSSSSEEGGGGVGVCEVHYFTVSQSYPSQELYIRSNNNLDGFEIELVDNYNESNKQAVNLLDKCSRKVLDEYEYLVLHDDDDDNNQENKITETEEEDDDDADADEEEDEDKQKEEEEEEEENLLVQVEALHQLQACLEHELTMKLMEQNEEIQFQTNQRNGLAALVENYTCYDEDMYTTSSDSIYNRTWYDKSEKVSYPVKVMLQRDEAKIHVIENFISPEECQVIETIAEANLHRGSVTSQGIGTAYSKARKAMQGDVSIPWHDNDHKITKLGQRVLDYSNSNLFQKLSHEGQEPLMSIQYFGSNYENGEEPDQYHIHCDGDCIGLPHIPGGRVATIIMYCEVPEQGGMTQFSNANIRVKPTVGSAVWFSYIGSDGIMDLGLTKHSGCPVLKGNKKLVTQWLRLGVDEEHPYDSFNQSLRVSHHIIENA